MAKQRVKFTFVQELITLPIIYELGKNFDLITNIRRADVTEDRGWVILEIEGEMDEIERAMIVKSLRHHAGNISRVAESLGLSRAALYRRFEKYEIPV